jgi:regulator of ribonuclease activity A
MTTAIKGAADITGDLCDAHKRDTDGSFRVLPPVFSDYGGRPRFAGPISTVKCFEDNSLVKAALEEPGQGRVLVVDGGGSLRRALVGGNIAATAATNGWAGMVVVGAVRDSAELRRCAIGIRALGLIPMPTERRGEGQRDLPLTTHGVRIAPCEWLVADEDGIVVMPSRPAQAESVVEDL